MRRHAPSLGVAAALLLVGCGDPELHDDEPQEQVERSVCGLEVHEPPERAVVRKVELVGATDGVTRGVDLDGKNSVAGGPKVCNRLDMVDEQGRTGIDNGLAALLPTLEAATGGTEAIESAFQRAINEGAILIMINLQHFDHDPDTCFEVALSRGAGRPHIGTLGLIAPGQTFERDAEATANAATLAYEGTLLEGGVIEAGPFEMPLPMSISGFDLMLTLRRGVLRFTLDDDGMWRGIIAGAVSIPELLSVIDEIEDGTGLLATIRTLLPQVADLKDEAGTCSLLSLTLDFEAAPAFFYDDAPR